MIKTMNRQNKGEAAPTVLQVVHRYFEVNARYTKFLILTIVFSILSSAALGAITQNFQSLINDFGTTGSVISRHTLIILCSLVILVPSQYLQQFSGLKYSALCDRDMRNKTFDVVSNIDMHILDTQKIGDILSRANDDLNQINWSLQNFFSINLPQQIIGIAALIVSLKINWQLTVFSLVMVPVFALLQVKISAPLTHFVEMRQKAAGESLSVANNLMGGYEVAKAYSMGNLLQQRYDTAVDDAAQSGIRANRATILLTPLSQILFFLPLIIICSFGVYLAGIGQIDPGGIMSVIILNGFIRSPIADFSSVLSKIKTARGCASRVFALWDMRAEQGGGIEAGSIGASIVFHNVAFSYPGKPAVLSGLSFRVNSGEHVALAGASGGGKSTVIKLLMALYQKDTGDIEVFGHKIENWSKEALRKYISYVGQDTFLFTGSIWDNIVMGNPAATDIQIRQVLSAARLDDIDVRREIGERGVHLSGGQKQRIAIARAMLKDAPLLLLDEPTSALDTQSEAMVSDALGRLMTGRTTIIIAHRLSALRNTDRILCMQNGRIGESGTHEELMSLGGVYYRLYCSQEEERHEINS